jgi:PleD family two-component response regulator
VIAPLPEPITVSIGIVEFGPGESGDALLHRVDDALYEAKRSGRNRVVAA